MRIIAFITEPRVIRKIPRHLETKGADPRSPPKASRAGVANIDGPGLGGRNPPVFQHPLSSAVPLLPRLRDIAARPLPGDANMPRVQNGSEGASERLAVSPGREVDGYFHMPCGQSGHPLSPHYRDSHPAWVAGERTPLLPGAAAHTLLLLPD